MWIVSYYQYQLRRRMIGIISVLTHKAILNLTIPESDIAGNEHIIRIVTQALISNASTTHLKQGRQLTLNAFYIKGI